MKNTINMIYVSGALTGINNIEETKKFYEAIGIVCQEVGFDVYIPHLYTDPINAPNITPQEVFKKDKEQVTRADLVIAYLGYPSLGVGMEIAYAEMNNIPIILMYEEDKIISRFPRGIPTKLCEIKFNTYEDALKQLQEVLEKLVI